MLISCDVQSRERTSIFRLKLLIKNTVVNLLHFFSHIYGGCINDSPITEHHYKVPANFMKRYKDTNDDNSKWISI